MFGIHFQSVFYLGGAAIVFCQSVKVGSKQLSRRLEFSNDNANLGTCLAYFPHALSFTLDALKESIQQISHLSLLSVHKAQDFFFIKCWSVGPPCKKLLSNFVTLSTLHCTSYLKLYGAKTQKQSHSAKGKTHKVCLGK